MTNQELTAELHEIVLADYGIDLSNEELFDMARTLTSFYGELIYGEEVKEDGETSQQDPDQDGLGPDAAGNKE